MGWLLRVEVPPMVVESFSTPDVIVSTDTWSCGWAQEGAGGGAVSVPGVLYLEPSGRIKSAADGAVPVGNRILALDVAELIASEGAPPPEGLVSITNRSVVRSNAIGGSSNSIAGYRINASGAVEKRLGATYSTLETWLLSGVASDYQVRAIVAAGSVSGSPTGTWIDADDSPEWYVQDFDSGTLDVSASLTIQLTNDGVTILDACAVELQSNWETV